MADFVKAKEKKDVTQKTEQSRLEEEQKQEEKTAEQLFEQVYGKATNTDIWSEYTFFLQHLPTLLEKTRAELIEIVEENLRIPEVKEKMAHQKMDHRKLNYEGDNYPILDALSIKIGLNLTKILAPPTQKCFLCKKHLQRSNKPATVTLHTLEGPELASKYQWECKCRATNKFRNKVENNTRVYYHVDMWGNPDMGFKFYPAECGVSVFRCSPEAYCHKTFVANYMSSLQYSFVSALGRCAAYNADHRNSKRVQFFKQFIMHNPATGGAHKRRPFHRDTKEGGEEEEEDEEEDEEEEEGVEEELDDQDDESGKEEDEEEKAIDSTPSASTLHELSRQKLTSAYFTHEVYSEMEERGHIESEIFGPQTDAERPDLKVSFKQSMLAYMEKVLQF